MGNACGCVAGQQYNSKAIAPAAPVDDIEQALVSARQELKHSGPGRFKQQYELGKIVGHGAFSKVQLCKHTTSGKEFAAKVVSKNTEELDKQREAVVKEVAIMRLLGDHPNVVQLQDVFEERDCFVLVMELCSGGELFDRIVSKGHFSEKEASERMRALLDFIAFAHSKHVMHRDLKPENILLADNSPGAALKIIDFGTSDFCRPGQRLSNKFGTPYYVAPEVLKRDYDVAADVWSAGVILYILLCGFPPFGGKNDARILQKVSSGIYTFAAKEWHRVSEQAKDMVTRMLVMDVRRRATAQELLCHPWFLAAQSMPEHPSDEGLMVRRLQAFTRMSRMKRLALVVLARTINDRDVSRLRELFVAMDMDGDGKVCSDDLHSALQQVGAAIDAAELTQLVAISDLGGSGLLDYEEFIAAMLDTSRFVKKEAAVRKSFESLDRDGDGFITVTDLAEVLEEEEHLSFSPPCRGPNARKKSMDIAASMVQEANLQGRICFEDYKKMLCAT